MYIFQLASQHAEWLAARQSTTAANIANANTPGYKAADAAPFETVLERTQLGMAQTNAGHIGVPQDQFRIAETVRESAWDISSSGNNVTLEAELMKISENGRMQALDTGVAKTFHRMILSSLKV